MSKKNQSHSQVDDGMLVAQPRLGRKGMIALITLCNIIAPLSTDMYMPALPEMKHYFHTNDAIMNLTLVGFFLFFAIGMLFFGPISDRNGRKPLLILGILVYIAACIGCTVSTSIQMLIITRIIQAIGAGCMLAVSTAMVKDQFVGKTQGSVLALAQVFGVLGPILSPLIGAQIYRLAGWRMVFIGQAAVTAVILVVALLMSESLPKEQRLDTGVFQSLSRLGVVMKNKVFALFLIGMIFTMVPMMAYIGSSSYIYQDFFGLSPSMYSVFFAATAFASVLGPVLYTAFREINPFKIACAVLAIFVAVGVVMLLTGHARPFVFAVLAALCMMGGAAVRPFATSILLNLQEKDTGAASSLSNFAFTIMGTIGMFLITSVWKDYIHGLSMLMMIGGVCGLVFILILLKTAGSHALHVHK